MKKKGKKQKKYHHTNQSNFTAAPALAFLKFLRCRFARAVGGAGRGFRPPAGRCAASSLWVVEKEKMQRKSKFIER
jgi:hypothetical protein